MSDTLTVRLNILPDALPLSGVGRAEPLAPGLAHVGYFVRAQ
jgi:hypothetical protein